MDRPWRIELLGWLRATQGEQVVSRFRTQKTGALLAYLAYHRRRSHPREELIEQHWPEADPAIGRHNLSMVLSSLRHQLEPPGVPPGAVIIADRAALHLNPAGCVTDVLEFEAALRAAARPGTVIERIQRLEAAAELYRGELLPGYFEEWIFPERERLADAFLQAIDQLVTLLEREGDRFRALQWARRGVAAEPLREEAHRDLMRLLAAVGQPEAALRQYRELERLLEMACGVAPEPESSALADAIAEGAAGGRAEAVNRPAPPPLLTSSPPPAPSPTPLPTGTVTFLLIEIPIGAGSGEPEGGGSGEVAVAARESCLELLRPLFRDYGGHEVRVGGEILPVMFGRTSDALAAAVAAQQALASSGVRGFRGSGLQEGPLDQVLAQGAEPAGGPECLKVRMALHTGEVEPEEEVEHGPAFRHAVRLLLAAHPGQILLSEKSAVLLRDAPGAGVSLVDLGLYRLRDQGESQRLFQAHGSGTAGAELPRPNAPPAHAGNLPLQFTRFFGREAEIARLREMLGETVDGRRKTADGSGDRPSSPDYRLLTLTGPGGCGKTRLALEAARRLREGWRNAAWFVSLADLAEPHRIADAVRDALHLPRTPDGEALERVVAFLSMQPFLLLIDNFEHLLPEGAATVQKLLERVETLAVLVTSRQRLGITGEQEFPVGPLPVPDVRVSGCSGVQEGPGRNLNTRTPEHLNTLIGCPSVQLFVDRAQTVRPDFQVTPGNAEAVAALCRRLEGLPLAIELVAARAQVLAPAQMLARLGGAGPVSAQEGLLVSRQHGGVPRHRSLRSAIDWSYQLLPPELQRFFARLSIFRGGWALEAAEAVCDEPRALEYLEKLRECSLILPDEVGEEMRYRLLETLREYGSERLAPEEQAALARRHAEYYLALVEQAEAGGFSADLKQTLDRLEAEHDNLRAVLAWSESDSGVVEIGLRLGGALAGFWMTRGYLREGRERLARLLARAGEARTPERARGQACAGTVAWGLGAMEEACSLLTEALAMARELNARREIAWSLRYLGNVAIFRGEYGRARTYLEESRALWDAIGNREQAAGCLNVLGHVARYQGDYAAARAAFEHDLERLRAVGDRDSLATQLKDLAILARYRGDYAEARSLAEESLALRREFGFRKGTAISLTALADVFREQGDLETARRLYEEALAIRQELGERYGVASVLALLAHVIRFQGDPDRARSLCRQSLAIRREILDRRGIAECLEGLAAVAAAEQQFPRSARLFAAAQALHDAIGSKAPPWERREQEQEVAALREALGEGGFLAAWNAGSALSWEQAVAEAMREG